MASDRPGDWRNPAVGKPPASRSEAPRTSRRAWQPGGPQAQPPAQKGRSRGMRLAAAGIGTLLLLGVLVWLIWLFWPARFPQLAVVGPMPTDSVALPLDVAGSNAATDLAAWAGETRDGDHPKLYQTAIVSVDAGGAKVTIDPDAKNLVLYIAAPGGADASGAYLWVAPTDARGAADAHKLRVSDILDRITASRRGKPTLLVFDCTRVTVSWPHGLLFNDFARALKELDDTISKCPGLAVICASDEDQRSGVLEERRTSAFGYYFLEALKGAGHGRGARVTAATAFDYTKGEVERWAVATRNEKQTPILLPATEGQARAERIDIAAAPAGGYQQPAQPEVPANVPSDLEDAWKTANDIAKQVPPPEANTPALWRDYLDMLLRWEHQFRLGANTNAVRDRVSALATQLRNPAVERELAAVQTAVPAGRALGRPPAFPEARSFELFRSGFIAKVWDAATPSDRTDGWTALLRANAGRETAVRTVAADLVLARLIEDSPTPANLRIAADILAITHGNAGLPAPAEAHFVRMLQLYLADPPNRPDPALLKQAIALRREAEEAAWVFMAQPSEYAYPEGVFPWVRAFIESGDRNRELGQDLLFSADAKDWPDAQSYFDKARTEYARARADGRKVAAALAARDRVFARLPYYARWLASYRGNRPQTEIDRLLDRAKFAAEKAHQIAEMTAKDSPSLDQLDKLDTLRAEADGHLKAIADIFDADVAALTNTPLPSNWHALDSALTVPFIPARRRAELLGYLRHVSHQLEVNRQQPDGSKVPTPQMREIAARHGRVALALLNDLSPDLRQLLERPDPHAWWSSYRAASDQIGERFRALAGEAKSKCDDATRTPKLEAAGAPLAEAARLARLAEPAAPMLAGSDPIAADFRFRRHDLLLWHAKRVTTEGWADVVRTTPDGWYCRKVAALLVASAESLIRTSATELTGRPVENMSPGELDRWLASCRAEAARRPVVLNLTAAREQEVADELSWEFALSLTAAAADRPAVGFPVSWLDAPGKPFPQAAPGTLGRRLERSLVDGLPQASRKVRFIAAEQPRNDVPPGSLTTSVLYRGNIYQNPTAVTLVGAPTREWIYNPPQGDACFAVRAGIGDRTGAVTILIDLSRSMTDPVNENDPKGRSRLGEAKKGLEQLLQKLPEGTKITLAYFYGDKTITQIVERFAPPVTLDGTNWEKLYKLFRDVKEDDVKKNGESTPLAGAILKVLHKDAGKPFWPSDGWSGARTLIVLTDGDDNWESVYKTDAGSYALDALLATEDDVHLHLVFFGLNTAEEKKLEEKAMAQFKVLTNRDRFLKQHRTPAELLSGIEDARRLADVCQRAMLPQFPFYNEKGKSFRLEATIPGSTVTATPPLPAGIYDFWGLRGSQSLQLRPGDRVMVQTHRDDVKDKPDLYLPTYAFETADKLGFPQNSAGTEATAGIRATIPELKLVNKSNDADISMVMTLEPIGARRALERLNVTRPTFVWFDAAYADGKLPDKGFIPGMRIENRIEDPTRKWKALWAPAWNLTLSRWAPAGIDLQSVRHPAVTGYWLDEWPVPAASFPLNLNELTGSSSLPEKSVSVHDSLVTLRSVTVEKFAPAGGPEGDYLTVRVKYAKPGEFVFVRPGNIKGGDQLFQLYERHVYYDSHSLYTARFGPLRDTDPNKNITLDLYSVADLKEAAAKRAVTVRMREGALKEYGMPQELEIQPRRE
jgi:hypothetical protein